MEGGVGHDTYHTDSSADVIVEAAGQGHDLVFAAVNWTLGATLQDLTLTGSATVGNGTGGANILTGNDLGVCLGGGGGNDTIYGGSGADTPYGGAGDDVMYGGGGNFDVFHGGEGGDTYYFFGPAGSIAEGGTTGRDKVVASVTWTLGATIEDLTLAGTATTGTGNSQANILTGNAVNNALTGGSGDDTLYGLGGDDTLQGGIGNDVIVGGRGVDRLTGNSGADQFNFASLAEMASGAGPLDTITDFRASDGDKIDLSGIDARTGSGNQAFVTIGAAAFSGVKGELRIIASGANLLVSGDVDGDNAADFAVLVLNVAGLADSDFSL